MTRPFPEWLNTSEPLRPTSAPSRFLTKNLLNLAHVLAHFNASQHVLVTPTSGWMELITLLVSVTAAVMCQNVFIFWLLMLLQLVTLLWLPGRMLADVLHGTANAIIVSGIIVLPGLLMNGWLTAIWWLARLSLVLLSVQSFRHRVSWRKLLVAMRQLHIPSLFILTLDITVKYSHLLGSRLQTNLEAVWLRSSGSIKQPLQLATRLISLLYLQSRHQAVELYQAMWLRGYTEKPTHVQLQWHPADWILVARNVCIVGMIVWFI